MLAWLLLPPPAAAAGCATDLEATYREATLARRRGDATEALARYARVLEADAHHAAAHLYTGYLLDEGGDRDAAIPHYRAALAGSLADPGEARQVRIVALNNLAFALARSGRDLAEADRLIREALAAAGERPGLLDTFAVVLLRRARPAEARQVIERAVELAPDDDGFRETQADVCLALGDTACAREALAEALAARPAMPARARALADRLEALGGVTATGGPKP